MNEYSTDPWDRERTEKARVAAAEEQARRIAILRDALWDADIHLNDRKALDVRPAFERLADAVREFLDPRP